MRVRGGFEHGFRRPGILLALVVSLAAPAVHFPDPALEAIVREAIDKPRGAIQPDDLAALTRITIFQSEVRDLSGIEHCVNLTFLNCQSNQVERIDCLAAMPQLEVVWLTHNRITDIRPLRDLPALHDLAVSYNPITDISVLAGMDTLRRLGLGGIRAADVSALATLTGLEELYVSDMGLANLDFVARMPNLRILTASENQITSIAPLRNLHSLQELQLHHNAISDLTPISELTSLWQLDLGWNVITDIRPLPPMRERSFLLLAGNRIQDIAPLLDVAAGAATVEIELGNNDLDRRAFCDVIPALVDRGHTVVHAHRQRPGPPESVPFSYLESLCGTSDGQDTTELLAAINTGESAVMQLAGRLLATSPVGAARAGSTGDPGIRPPGQSDDDSAIAAEVAERTADERADDDMGAVPSGCQCSLESAAARIGKMLGDIFLFGVAFLSLTCWSRVVEPNRS